MRLRSALLARRASDEISWGHDVFFHSVPAAHTLVRGVNGKRLRRHSADSTLPPLWPTGSSSGWLPSIPARSFSAGPSDSASRRTPCPPRFPSRPARRYPRLWIWCPPSEHQWDFNPPEHVAAQRTLWSSRIPAAPRSFPPVLIRVALPRRGPCRRASRVSFRSVSACCAPYPAETCDTYTSGLRHRRHGLRREMTGSALGL